MCRGLLVYDVLQFFCSLYQLDVQRFQLLALPSEVPQLLVKLLQVHFLVSAHFVNVLASHGLGLRLYKDFLFFLLSKTVQLIHL
jgi:hypothetical protein